MEIAIIILVLISCGLLFMLINKVNALSKLQNEKEENQFNINELKNILEEQNRILRNEMANSTQSSVVNLGGMLSENIKNSGEYQRENLLKIEKTLNAFSIQSEQKLENIRKSVETKLTYLQEDNNKQLEKMRNTVDEKLQKTLEDKMTQSFALVNERLEQVYKGLGEMQSLANGVGDLKKVLSNVKTRGILGEIQLASILKEILSSEQYEENVVTKKGTRNVVEFAIKLPGDDENFIFLPIDAKFPADTYQNLLNAYDTLDKTIVAKATKDLIATIKKEAKDIRDKYIDPPNTTDFAIMFLPIEGLYAQAVNNGLVEILQREYKVNIAGPSTMAALLNSLQMGFKTLAVQKRSAEVFKVLEEVKTEFDKFADALEKTQGAIDKVNTELDKLVGVRTRQMQKKLTGVSKYTIESNVKLIESKKE